MRLCRMLHLAGVEVSAVVEVWDEADLGWAPAELFLGFRAGSRAVDGDEVRHPIEMSAGFVGRLAHDRHVQTAADHGSYFAEGNAFVADSMILGACFAFLKREPIETSGIEPVDCRPAIRSITYVSGDALFASDADEAWNETVVPVTVAEGGRRIVETLTPRAASESVASSDLRGKLAPAGSSSMASAPLR